MSTCNYSWEYHFSRRICDAWPRPEHAMRRRVKKPFETIVLSTNWTILYANGKYNTHPCAHRMINYWQISVIRWCLERSRRLSHVDFPVCQFSAVEKIVRTTSTIVSPFLCRISTICDRQWCAEEMLYFDQRLLLPSRNPWRKSHLDCATQTWPQSRAFESFNGLTVWNSLQNPADVDFKVMATFLEFYTTLLGFINFKLYSELGLIYPPKVGQLVWNEHGNGLF
jgi:hypothetical protein